MVAKKRGLGRGLDALLPRSDKPPATEAAVAGTDTSGQRELPVEWLQAGRFQPRTYFDEAALEELASSIRAQGLMQPIVVRSLDSERFEIIAGERRWRAAQRAGLEKVAVIVREADDESALAMSLIENIQREDLNPLEEASALQRLIDEFQFTHQEVAEAVGRSRSSVSNTLRLTQLAPPVADMLARGDLEMGHARALLTLDRETQAEVARTIAARGLNVRQTEAMVRGLGKTGEKRAGRRLDPDIQRLQDRLGEKLGQPVRLQHSARGKGQLVISYNTLDELDGILGRLGYED